MNNSKPLLHHILVSHNTNEYSFSLQPTNMKDKIRQSPVIHFSHNKSMQ